MSLITDVRAVSENAIEQLAARFAGLPRPLLAAIGAGDMAIERLAELRESLLDSVGDRVSAPSIDITDVRSAASDLGSRVSDLPSRAQKIAADVAGGIEQFAADAPAKAQEMIAQMPEKLAEFQAAAESLSPDAVKETFDAYTQLVGLIYGNLADRGDKTWAKVRSSGMRAGTVVDAVAATARPVAQAAAKAPARAAARVTATVPLARAPRAQAPTSPSAPKAARATAPRSVPPKAAQAPAAKLGMTKPAAAKLGTTKPAAAKLGTAKPAAEPAAPKRAARPRAMATPGAAKRAAGKSADRVIPSAAPKFVTARQTVRRSSGKGTVIPVVETVVVTPAGPGA
jgi:hypothetical protein